MHMDALGGRLKAINYASIMFFVVLIFLVLIYERLQADVGNGANSKKFITVLVIDTGVDHRHPIFSDRVIKCPNDLDCTDFWRHGTQVASIILNGELDSKNKPTNKVCERVLLHSCDYKPNTGYKSPLISCLNYAKWLKPDFVNFSSSGKEFVEEEYLVYEELKNTTFVVAAGNEGDSLYESPSFPAIFPSIEKISPKLKKKNLPNVITVGASTSSGNRWILSNFADFVKYEKGLAVKSASPNGEYDSFTGTSASTALYTNKLIKGLCDESK